MRHRVCLLMLLSACARTGSSDFDGDGVIDVNDCGPDDDAVFPGALDEVDPDGIDSNCDGVDGQDNDGDGVASQATGGEDCNDDDPSIHPGAIDVPGTAGAPDQVDQDCDGVAFSCDIDGDGVFRLDETCAGTDCDDDDPLTHPGLAERCDGTDNDCDGSVPPAEAQDLDQDLSLACEDCDDVNGFVLPGAVEVCDGLDTDCDANTALVGGERDDDGDGYLTCAGPFVDHAAARDLIGAADCDDTNRYRWPSASEVCDGLDNDCDEGTQASPSELDGDGDGFLPCPDFVDHDATGGDGAPIVGAGDCDDDDDAAFPGRSWRVDADGDGYGDDATAVLSCAPVTGRVLQGGDCDDSTDQRRPGLAELCDGLDNDCDAATASPPSEDDQDADGYLRCLDAFVAQDTPAAPALVGSGDCVDTDAEQRPGQVWYLDSDGDGHGNAAQLQISCTRPPGFVVAGDDCDDATTLRVPGHPEVCDGLDNACDGLPEDEADADGDRYVACDGYVARGATNADGLALLGGADCDDADAAQRPGQRWYVDQDGDGSGTGADTVACARPVGQVADASDCDDDAAWNRPDGTEICDGLDNDCNGQADFSGGERDVDQDGWVACTSFFGGPTQPPGAVPVVGGGDCDDALPNRFPGAAEACDGVDNDCDGALPPFDLDGDGDGAAACLDCDDADDAANLQDVDGDGVTSCDGDCDDGTLIFHPFALDPLGDGWDTNCDGLDGVDRDGDDFASVASGGLDCDDLDAAVHPGALEAPGDAVDQDCDGFDGTDADGDGWQSSPGTDCDDSAVTVHPGQWDRADDGVDANCDGVDATPHLVVPTTGGASDVAYTLRGGCDPTGDGVPDLVIGASMQGGAEGAVFISPGPVRLGSAFGPTGPAISGPGVSAQYFGCPGDLNDDGVDDVVVTVDGELSLFLGPITGPRSASTADWSTPGPWAASAVGGDFDGDGRRDLAWCGGATGCVVYRGDPTVTLEPLALLDGDELGAIQSLVAGDWNGDGVDDLAVSGHDFGAGTGVVYVFYGPLAGELSVASAGATVSPNDASVQFGSSLWTVADRDGDGADELLVGEFYVGAWGNPGRVLLFDGPVLGALSDAGSAATQHVDGFLYQAAATDFDGDGETDLAWVSIRHDGSPGWSVGVRWGPLAGARPFDPTELLLVSTEWDGGAVGNPGIALGVPVDGTTRPGMAWSMYYTATAVRVLPNLYP